MCRRLRETMVVIRPITLEDLAAIEALTDFTGFGLTTLPKDTKLLRKRIRDSMRGFAKLCDEDPPGGETYLFVMEDLESHKVVGTCGIVSKVGGFEPFYAYRVETEILESQQLNVRKEIRTLHLVEQHDGPCEIGSLFLSPDHRKDNNGRLLSLSRFLFMAEHIEYFDPIVIAEMRGVVDDHGHSPFWDAVGHHFFDIDFPKADYLSMVNKKFIADLMPKHPLYIPLLPAEAQKVVGQVHPETAPALKMLEDEAFKRCGMVDIFEAGPVVRCRLEEIRSIRHSTRGVVEAVTAVAPSSDLAICSNTRQDFRACKAIIEVTATGGLRISSDVARALQVKPGDTIRYVTARPKKADGDSSHDAPSSL
jgi:arginine N-succinyltransferase